MRRRCSLIYFASSLCTLSCFRDTDGNSASESTTSPATATEPSASDATVDDSSSGATEGSSTTAEPVATQLDVLFVIDNSGGLGEEQDRLGNGLDVFVTQLRNLALDVNLMVTTTDMGSPACEGFQPADYEPARGSPITTPCTERLQDFTNLGQTQTYLEACTDHCARGIVPDDAFVHFAPDGDNVTDGTPLEALRCLVPQGMNGCGYEAPLEAMYAALQEDACWNAPDQDGCEQYTLPFLRPDADLAIVLLTDETDCSVSDPAFYTDPAYMNINPSTGMLAASSAMCWNAGMDCEDPDGDGAQTCIPAANPDMFAIDRYVDRLVSGFAGAGKRVFMLGIVGVPLVSAYAESPAVPLEGGVAELVYRDWIAGTYPDGDILPSDAAVGVTVAEKRFSFGIGPSCFEEVVGTAVAQALPPGRLRKVCESLDLEGSVRCSLDSICDGDYGSALQSLTGMIAHH